MSDVLVAGASLSGGGCHWDVSSYSDRTAKQMHSLMKCEGERERERKKERCLRLNVFRRTRRERERESEREWQVDCDTNEK